MERGVTEVISFGRSISYFDIPGIKIQTPNTMYCNTEENEYYMYILVSWATSGEVKNVMTRILLVEDEKNLRDLYITILQEQGYTVETAEDGETGLSAMQKGGYDLVLLDIMLPKMDGLTIMTQLQKNPPIQKNGPVLFLTNANAESTIAQGVSLDVRGYLIKSDYSPDQLVQEIKRVLEEERHQQLRNG